MGFRMREGNLTCAVVRRRAPLRLAGSYFATSSAASQTKINFYQTHFITILKTKYERLSAQKTICIQERSLAV